MKGGVAGTTLVALAVALLLTALSLVAWRQSRAREALAELDLVRRERTLQESEKEELLRRIRYLESRGRVVGEAEERLGLGVPDDSEMVFLEGVIP
jgi:cell division protein FtsL